MNFQRINFARDMDVCVKFREDSFRASYPGSNEWKLHWDEADYRSWILEHARRFPDGALHLIDKDDIIGQLEFRYGEANGHVNLFYLRPDVRGAGYGEVLQTHVKNVLRAKGCLTATLRVSPKNQRAVRFYVKHGWTDCGPDSQSPQVNLYRINLHNAPSL
jgi:GNAT superfamily N-acetyltransferase